MNKMNMAFIIRLGSNKQNSNVKSCAFYGFGFFL